MSPEYLETLNTAFAGKNWPLVAAVLIGFLVMLGKSSLFGGVINRIPKEYRAAVPLVLGILSGISDALFRGTPWISAVVYGVLSGLVPIGGDQALDVVRAAQQKAKASEEKPID